MRGRSVNEAKRAGMIAAGWEIHAAVEEAALGAADPVERRRLLLADMAIHLLQTAIRPGEIELNQLRNNLHAILTLSDAFLPESELKKATELLMAPRPQVCLYCATVAGCAFDPKRTFDKPLLHTATARRDARQDKWGKQYTSTDPPSFFDWVCSLITRLRRDCQITYCACIDRQGAIGMYFFSSHISDAERVFIPGALHIRHAIAWMNKRCNVAQSDRVFFWNSGLC